MMEEFSFMSALKLSLKDFKFFETYFFLFET